MNKTITATLEIINKVLPQIFLVLIVHNKLYNGK